MTEPHDIDAVIRGVQHELPQVTVQQMVKYHPADDDGLWWFRVPGVERDIQVESSSYDCPFYVEHDDMKSATEAITASTVPEVVALVISYLRPATPETQDTRLEAGGDLGGSLEGGVRVWGCDDPAEVLGRMPKTARRDACAPRAAELPGCHAAG